MYAELREVWSQLTGPGAPFEVKEIMIRGLMTKTYASGPSNLRDVWLSSVAHGDKDYLVYQDERWTFAQAHKDAASVASDPRLTQLREVVGILLDGRPDRAQRVQLMFSDSYDVDWRAP